MLELSNAAQAVLASMYRSYDHEPTRCLIAADVLRAAALYCKKDKLILLSMADELEGASND